MYNIVAVITYTEVVSPVYCEQAEVALPVCCEQAREYVSADGTECTYFQTVTNGTSLAVFGSAIQVQVRFETTWSRCGFGEYSTTDSMSSSTCAYSESIRLAARDLRNVLRIHVESTSPLKTVTQ